LDFGGGEGGAGCSTRGLSGCTVEVDFVVVAVIMLVSLSLSSSESSGGTEGIVVFRRRFGDDWTGLETGTAEAERRVPATEDRLARAILDV